MAAIVAILDVKTEPFYHVAPMPCIKFQLTIWEQITIKDFGCGHLGYQNKIILAILNLHVAPMPPTKFWLSDSPFWGRCGLKIFKMAPVANSKSLFCSDASPQAQLHPTYCLGGDVV